MNSHTGAMRRGHGALILVILIAMAIVLYLMFGSSGSGGSGAGGTGNSSYMGQVSQSRKSGKAVAADISTQQLSILIAQYRQENNNKLPKSPADFDNPGAFKDPWGGELSFAFFETMGKTMVTYKSKGPDGEAGTEDDVSKTDALPF
jgi:preprotein translocase subunit SecG